MAIEATAVLAGQPDAVSGFVPFHNATDAAVTVSEVTVGDTDTDATLAVAIERTVVPPGGRVRLAVRLRLPPQTPPGAYPLVVTVADVEVPALAHVVASHLVAVTPEVVVVENRPGEKLGRNVVVANEGNVDVHLPDPGALPLYREDAALATLWAIAEPLVAPTGPLDPLPDPVADLQLTIERDDPIVGPGQARSIELVVVVPDELPQSHRYLAALPISIGTLLVTVVPAGAPGSRRGDATRRRAGGNEQR